MSKSNPIAPPASEIDFINNNKLFQQLTNPEVISLIKDFNERYLYWDEVKRRKIPETITHEELWKLLKLNRKLKSKQLNISKLSGYKFTFSSTDAIAKSLHRFDLNLGGVLEGSTTIPEGQGDKYMINALMEEAIASSQLEGAATTRKIAKELLRTERKPKNLSEQMIVNNYTTVKELKKISNRNLTPELILHIHKTITNGTLDLSVNEGKFRNNNNINVVDGITGEIYYTPPDYNEISQVINDICDFANSKQGNDFIHPIIRAITLHFLIGYLHPFVDGNGRTARALFYWYLLSKGYWLIEFISISKAMLESPSLYSRAYVCTEKDGNDLTYFYNYNVKTLLSALKGFRKYISKQISEKSNIYALQKIRDINERQVEIIYKIQKEKHKMLSIKEVQNTYNVVYQTARMDLLGLEKRGFLQQKLSGKKLLFFKSDQFDKLIGQANKDDL